MYLINLSNGAHAILRWLPMLAPNGSCAQHLCYFSHMSVHVHPQALYNLLSLRPKHCICAHCSTNDHYEVKEPIHIPSQSSLSKAAFHRVLKDRLQSSAPYFAISMIRSIYFCTSLEIYIYIYILPYFSLCMWLYCS